MPNGASTQASSPLPRKIDRQAKTLTRYDAHSGIRIATTSRRRTRGLAIRAM